MLKHCENLDISKGKTKILHPFTKLKTQESHYCRICKDCESSQNLLITPCRCSGYIHEKCLKTWMKSQEGEKSRLECELCKTKYKFEYIMTRRCSVKGCFDDGCLHFIYLPIIFVLMVIGFFACYLSVLCYFTVKLSEDERKSMIWNIIVCGFAGFSMLYLIISTFLQFCFKQSVSECRILSQHFPRISIDKVENDVIGKEDFIENFIIASEK